MKRGLALLLAFSVVICLFTGIARADGVKGYKEYSAAQKDFPMPSGEEKTSVDITVGNEIRNIQINVANEGYYKLGFLYKALGEGTAELVMGLKIDGSFPFEEAEELELPRMFVLSEETRVDGLGNEFSPEVKPGDEYTKQFFIDTTGWSIEPYMFYFTKGQHTLEILPIDAQLHIKEVLLAPNSRSETYKGADKEKYYEGKQIEVEGEDADVLSSYWHTSKADSSSASVSPTGLNASKINYIGGGTWKSAGEYIGWKVNVPESGYYKLGFSYRQAAVINGNTYRSLTVDGKSPFAEAEEIDFLYCTDWESKTFTDPKGKPYLIYLEKGIREIGLTATPGPISQISDALNETVSDLGNLYMSITMITGDTPDNYRDYALFEQLPHMEETIKQAIKTLQTSSKALQKISGDEGNSYDSSIKSMEQILSTMLDNKYTAHRYVTDYYSKYCSLASSLNEMREMPLEIDKLILAAPDSEIDFAHAGFFKQLWFGTYKFISSFVKDYNNISGIKGDQERITIWVNWGRDQAQILNFLAQAGFTSETGIPVEVKVVNATIVQSVLSGNQPDVILQQPRSEPVNLAMRDVLLDLSEFEDCDEVLSRFQEGAETPYRYKDGLYALPDQQTFYLMFYRTDIFENLGLEVPKTWDEFISTAKLLARNNLDVWLPYTQITAVNQVNTGIGSLNLFSSLLLQNNLSLYTEDGRATTLTDTKVIKTFEYWTDFYTKLKVPVTMSFYNRFRVGTCPIGIEQYTNFTTLKAAAPEIEGLWSVSELPGTVDKEGNLNRATSGGGTGCCIMKATDNKESAWEFLKWWTSADTQYKYTNNLESVLGPTGRIAVSNIEAFEKMSWDIYLKEDIIKAWKNVEEIPEVPGSYFATRSVDLAFWNVVNQNKNPKDVLLRWGTEVDDEIERKWAQYDNRK